MRRLVERQRELGRILTREKRLATVRASTVEMIRPSLYGQAIILLVYEVFGDEFEPMQKAAHEVAAALRAVRGATDVKVEQAGGLPVLEIKVDKSAIARRGLSVSAVQEVIGAAVGGQEAGGVFEGDRSFDIVVRLPESVRSDLEALGNLPVALARATPNSPVQSLALNRVARFSFSEGPNQISRENGKRRIVVSANVRGRDLGSVVEEAQARVRQGVRLPPDTG